MRCVVEADISGEGVKADLRLGRSNGVSVASAPRAFDEKGGASLVLADDTHESADLVLVLIDADGRVLAEKKTKVGMSS